MNPTYGADAEIYRSQVRAFLDDRCRPTGRAWAGCRPTRPRRSSLGGG